MESGSGVNSEYGTDVLLLLGPLPSGRGRLRYYSILIGDEFRNFFYDGNAGMYVKKAVELAGISGF